MNFEIVLMLLSPLKVFPLSIIFPPGPIRINVGKPFIL